MSQVDALSDPARLSRAIREARASEPAFDVRACEDLRLEPQALLDLLGATYHVPVLRLDPATVPDADFDTVNLSECLRRGVLVERLPGGARRVLFVDPADAGLQDWLRARMPVPAPGFLVLDSEMRQCLSALERSTTTLARMGLGAGPDGSPGRDPIEEITAQPPAGATSAAVGIVNSTLHDALRAGASDLHFESVADGLSVRYRIDGVLSQAGNVDGAALAEQVISRIKVLAELDITERRRPQDGRFKARWQRREIDFRVSVMPSVHGEDAVIRVLDKEHLGDRLSGLTLDHLRFDEPTCQAIRGLARRPYGMLLVTGPTGSGKTTTLYAVLSEINEGRDKIVTIEDPVEYQLGGVLQIPVNERKGLTFEVGLRSILRHDPDRIMVGEIRDGETARIAVQAALTGHLVFSTVHANNAFDVLGRFEHMGVDPYSLVSALNAIVAQRLVRMVCPHCALRPVPAQASGEGAVARPGGCPECRHTGYKGRRAIAECLVLDDALREMIVARAPLRSIKAQAQAGGMISLRERAQALVREGLTTVDEMNRVTVAP